MSTTVKKIVYALVMIAVIIGVDLLFLRHLPWARLVVNVGIVLVFGVLYFRIFGRETKG